MWGGSRGRARKLLPRRGASRARDTSLLTVPSPPLTITPPLATHSPTHPDNPHTPHSRIPSFTACFRTLQLPVAWITSLLSGQPRREGVSREWFRGPRVESSPRHSIHNSNNTRSSGLSYEIRIRNLPSRYCCCFFFNYCLCVFRME